jgi:hypothetical protein
MHAWSDGEAEALRRWDTYGVPEARRLDGQIAGGERAVEELRGSRDRGQRSVDMLDLDRIKSRLRYSFREISALRDRLDGIEPPSVAINRTERSAFAARGGQDHDHGLGRDNDRGSSRDLGVGLGR